MKEIKEQLVGQHQISMEDSQNQLVNLLHAEVCGNANDFYNFEKEIKNVKLKDVKEIAKKVADGKYSFFALIPK